MPTLLAAPVPSPDPPARIAPTTQPAAWRRGYAALRRYEAAEGHCRVPARYVAPDGYPLGHWVAWQRQRERHGWLRPDQRRRLECLGFDWRPRAHARSAAIDAATRAAAADPLGWTRTFDSGLARALRAARSRGRLTPAQVATLDALGFIWSDAEAHFARGLAALRGYRAAGGAFPVGRTLVWDGVRLGEWVCRQRDKAVTGHLPAARWEALGAVVLGEPA